MIRKRKIFLTTVVGYSIFVVGYIMFIHQRRMGEIVRLSQIRLVKGLSDTSSQFLRHNPETTEVELIEYLSGLVAPSMLGEGIYDFWGRPLIVTIRETKKEVEIRSMGPSDLNPDDDIVSVSRFIELKHTQSK